jgi:hypothetical protein
MCDVPSEWTPRPLWTTRATSVVYRSASLNQRGDVRVLPYQAILLGDRRPFLYHVHSANVSTCETKRIFLGAIAFPLPPIGHMCNIKTSGDYV